VSRVSKLKVGDPRDPKTDLGPLMNQRQTDTFMKQVQRGIDEGAKVVLPKQSRGQRSLADGVRRREVQHVDSAQRDFGPAVCLMPFDTPEDGIRMANDSPYGLSGAVFTRDVEYGAEFSQAN